MITIIKRIGEFAKDFNELVDELYKITPTATRMEVVYKPFDYYEKIQISCISPLSGYRAGLS